MAFSEAQSAQILQGLGAPAGVNGADWLNQNPGQIAAYNAARSNAGDSWQFPNAAASDPSTSFVPLTVEPLNSTQKKGLTGLSTDVSQLPGNDAMQAVLKQLQAMQGQPTINPIATNALTKAQGYTAAGAAPISQGEVTGLSNPFASGLNDQITQAGKVARAAITANQGLRGGAAFGNTSQGNELGLLDQGVTNATNTNNFNTFQSALNALLTQRGNNLTAGNISNNTAQTAQGVTNSGNANTLADLLAQFNAGSGLNTQFANTSANQINAGNQIQTQNQNVDNQIAGNIQGGINYPVSNLQNILSLLNNFQSNTSGAVAPANSLTQIGAGVGGASSVLGQLLGGSGGTSTSPPANSAPAQARQILLSA